MGRTSHLLIDMAPSLSLLPLPVLLILCAMVVVHPAAARGGDPLMLDRFHRWMSAHGRSYPTADEKLRRLEVYRRNVELIEATNRDSGRLGYELGENEFTDLTNEEFVARHTGALVPKEDADGSITTIVSDVNEPGRGRSSMVHLNASLSAAPANFDWRSWGVVTPAKNQGHCSSCWAFATVATIESLYMINGGEMLDLSEQEVLDCDVAGQVGCAGGYVDKALGWIQAQGGLVTEGMYPYQAWQLQCKATDATRFGNINGFEHVRGEPQLQLAVLQRPVAVIIDATDPVFKNYKGGIYKGPCTTQQNHWVVLIGYGVTNGGDKYWILKNSWGYWWGQNGFFYMRRGADGTAGLCGLAVWGYYPIM